MAEDTQNGAAGATPETPAGPSFSVEKIYVKDVSFEVPGAPLVFSEQAQPQLQLNLNQRVQRLGENSFEVVLGVTLTCNANDKPLYLAEVQQAGGFPPFYLQPINFEGLYAEGLRQRAAQGQQQASDGLAGSETAGNA